MCGMGPSSTVISIPDLPRMVNGFSCFFRATDRGEVHRDDRYELCHRLFDAPRSIMTQRQHRAYDPEVT